MKKKTNNLNDGNARKTPTAPSGADIGKPKKNNADNADADNKPTEKMIKWYKKSWVRKLTYFIIALLIAMTLWGYVLMAENPARTIRVDDIPVTFEAGSESDLYSRNLTLLSDTNNALPTISVMVKTTLNDLPRFKGRTTDIFKATVSLNTIHDAGTYELPITVTTTIGEIDRIIDGYVTITVDNLVERTIPVNVDLIGALPDNYWHDEPQLLSNSVVLRGAQSEISRIARATCEISLNGRTEPVNDSFTLNMYDSAGELVPASSIIGVLPSVTVRMNILPTIEYTLAANITGESSMKGFYGIEKININPPTITIAASRAVLDQIPSLLSLEVIDISDIDSECTLAYDVALAGLPNGAIIVKGADVFTVTIEIRELMIDRTFENIPVTILNEDTSHYAYSYEPSNSSNKPTCSVTIHGKASIVSAVKLEDLKLIYSVEGLNPGSHFSLYPELELNDDLIGELTWSVTPIGCIITLIDEPTATPAG